MRLFRSATLPVYSAAWTGASNTLFMQAEILPALRMKVQEDECRKQQVFLVLLTLRKQLPF